MRGETRRGIPTVHTAKQENLQKILESGPGQKLPVAVRPCGPSVLLIVRDICGLLGHGCMFTQSLGEKDLLEGPSLVPPTGWSALMWRSQDELSHDGELLTRKTNRGKKRKGRDRKESPNSPTP